MDKRNDILCVKATKIRSATADHAFVNACKQHGIGQKFTCVNRSNGKAERVICTLMDMWHSQARFKDADRHIQLIRFINFYNTVNT
ncbi:MAG: hypothetical protein IPP22_00545 [Nitrosomonas sp.]|nr:hypothetical protein [Nitrosomonas sp.]